MKVKLTVTAFLIILCIFVVGCSKSKTEPETTEPSTEETTTQKESNTGFSTFAAAVTGATESDGDVTFTPENTTGGTSAPSGRGEPERGMTKAEVLKTSWGQPNRVVTTDGIEAWIYDQGMVTIVGDVVQSVVRSEEEPIVYEEY